MQSTATASDQRPADDLPMTAARRHARGFWLITYVFVVIMASSTLPTPLYPLYQRAEHFGSLVVTVVFAAYAFGVLAALLLGGHLSDQVGRRPLLLAALAIAAVSDVQFATSTALAALLAARVLSGLSVGLTTSTATAYLADLHGRARPGGDRRRADQVAAAANLGGLGLGPPLSGLIAAFAVAPLHLPYLVSLGLIGLGLLAVMAAPETVAASGPRRPYRPQRLVLPPSSRRVFTGAAVASLAACAVFGLFTSLAPAALSSEFKTASPIVAGLVTLLVFGAGAVAQITLDRWRPRTKLLAGLGVLAAGLALLTTGVWLDSLPLFLIGGAIAGGGAGLTFRGSISTALSLAEPRRRGGTVTAVFLAGYAGLAVPVLGLGAATQTWSITGAVPAFAAALLVLLALAFRWVLASRLETNQLT